MTGEWCTATVPAMLVAAPRSVASLLRARRRGVTASATIALCLIGAPAATAQRTCTFGGFGVGDAPALHDPAGYLFDSYHYEEGDPEVERTDYATLSDGGSRTPLAPRAAGDAYDYWGQLFIGGQGLGDQYTSSDPAGCTRAAGGRTVVFAPVPVNGLAVQRELFVSATTGSGARLTDTLRNNGALPVTTSVYVGDLTAAATGRLGSGEETIVTASSSGDRAITAEDRWAVTAEDSPMLIDAPPAIAHVWDGPSGRERANLAQLGGAPITGAGTLGNDQFGYGWRQVTIAPGETASYVSWSLQRVTAAGDAESQGAAAAQAAQELMNAPYTRLYEGLTAAQVASVRNWPIPQPVVTIEQAGAAPAATSRTLSIGGDPSGGLPVCGGSTTSWSLPGGTATGASVTTGFPVGATTVQATVENACGGRASVSTQVLVAAPDAPAGPPASGQPGTPQSQPLALLSLRPLERIKRSHLRSKRGAALRFTSPVGGRLTLTLKAKGLTIRGKATLRAGRGKTLRVRVSAKQRRALALARRVTLRATLTTADGRKARLSQRLRLR